MLPMQHDFIAFAIETGLLRFGEFTLKSGRKSPYFFNIGEVKSGNALSVLGRAYADALQASPLIQDCDVIFGPAYKGITLACSTAIALVTAYQIDKPIAYNRKETKDHGEGGDIVGADLKGKRVVLLDDVITSGKTLYEADSIIRKAGGKLSGVLIALDREEAAIDSQEGAIACLRQRLQIPIQTIVSLTDIITYIRSLGEGHPLFAKLATIEPYRMKL